MTNTKNTFLSKLQTLKSFIDGMGIKASDDVLSDVLKKNGHNVELALERILTGNGSISNDGAPTHNNSLATSTKKRANSSTGNATASSKKRSSTGLSSSSLSTSSKMPKSRHSFGGAPSLKDNTHTVQQQPTNRLLLCKRWTIASSRSTRGRVSYGEMLDFSQNWNNHETGQKSKLINPLVRFRSKSGYVEGTLNRYLCSILVPLLHLPATNHDNKIDQFIPLVSIEGETLMEDRLLVIGSEIPLTLKVYINDPISFFELFSSGKDGIEKSNAASSAKLFFQSSAKKKSSGMPSYQGKKAKSSFSDEELAEAAFHLLQWADKGEELPFKRKEETKEKLKEDTTTLDLEVAESNSTLENGDGDYEDSTSLASEQVDELNQLVVSDEQVGKLRTLSELSDPTGFKKDIKLHAYQREALHWMCRREGVHIKGEMNSNSLEDETGELDLLAELVSLSASDNSDPSIQDKAVSCDCGAVVVSNELLESGEIVPVAEYGKERKEGTNNYHHHPLWKRRFLATGGLTSVYSFYVNELLGVASAFSPDPPKHCNGGILADAMGLGKTIMLLALVLKTKENVSSRKKRPSDSSLKPERASKRAASSGADDEEEIVDLSSDIETDNDDDESYTDDDHSIQMLKRNNSNGTTTLVIAPLSLVSQWEEELATKTDLSHLMYYENKKATGCDVFSSCDVVVTTYGTVQSEYASWTGSAMKQPGQSHPLLAFDWKRIILDEAHGIKNPSTIVSKACRMLKAESRWCVTGTPIQK